VWSRCTNKLRPDSYGFNVKVDWDKPYISCNAVQSSVSSIQSLPWTACEDASVTFRLDVQTDSADLWINWNYEKDGDLTGFQHIPSSEFVWINTEDPNGSVQVYNGTTDFIVPSWNVQG
jgi:hypothetical protein